MANSQGSRRSAFSHKSNIARHAHREIAGSVAHRRLLFCPGFTEPLGTKYLDLDVAQKRAVFALHRNVFDATEAPEQLRCVCAAM
jgi:hypothetical protein